MIKERLHISNAEYASSRTRLDVLQKIVIDGNNAEAIIKFADRFVDEIGKDTLEAIANNRGNLAEQEMTYRVAVKFASMIKGIASQGKQKEATLQSLQK